ncbi:MAG TPA: LamG-like jellyroll fold domain-containing protein [Saprospiraceae bacterium]|nr:LamG-like jellyroll fold domain-containing protein [Saprospiraceae bacterium]
MEFAPAAMRIFIISIFLISSITILPAQVSQINIARVDLMPNEPSPFTMRDWKEVAIGYDSFVYDINKTGLYLPLIFTRAQGTNYPQNPSFGLDSYVGTNSNNNGEAINVMSSLVGASLVGVDKTDQYGMNWILMSQDYFNKNNGEFLYLNNIGGHSGGDWWYDMMPNVYFYQLYDLYGKIGDAENQFKLIADRMTEAVKKMGGKTTPWTRASMEYRAWDFLNMVPNPDGVHEPEAAGAFAWLLYNAYKQNGNKQYLQAAEWSMEYLNNLNTNPSYELQLPYGAYAAAKMNAEIGTKYNIEKLLFWIFNRGPLRGWGTIVGEWGSNDVSGLVGEANDGGNDYAFQLNGVQQAGQLAPLVRYDKRFARAIGKWMLNVANATRLMYPGFLPDSHQDSHTWSDMYDPEGVMGYEALREKDAGLDLVSTGDAIKGGWAGTNLSLYSTSSIGYLGAILEKTNQEKILKIDLLKTDFFRDTAYPSYLLFNPYTTLKSVVIDAGPEPTDIYDAISETFLAQNVTTPTSINIPADKAVSIVLAPSAGSITYRNNEMLIDGVVVDYQQTAVAYNYPPRIQSFAPDRTTVEKGDTITLYGKGIDQETKDLVYTFIFEGETKSGLEKEVTFIAPDVVGTYEVKLVVEDENQQRDSVSITIDVVSEINFAPEIQKLAASSKYTHPGGTIHIASVVTDGNDDTIIYSWSVNGGNIIGTGNEIAWTAPGSEGIFTLQLSVSDGRGGTASASIKLFVYDTGLDVDGDLIAWYPFAGNALDISGHNLNGTVSGAKLTPDSLGHPSEAYFFDGINDHIRVANNSILNFTDGITVALFVQPQLIGDKERFIISHGSWQNRWKLSITPDLKVRWTVKNASGAVRDLDSETIIEANKFYHIAATYNGRFMMIYINGLLESFTAFSGAINASPLDMEIGQIMPDDPSYNFRGVLDDIRIYDFAQLPDSVAAESGHIITAIDEDHVSTDFSLNLFPNPALRSVTIEIPSFIIVSPVNAIMTIFDINGNVEYHAALASGPTKTIDISSFLPGIHILRIMHDGRSMIKKFITE